MDESQIARDLTIPQLLEGTNFYNVHIELIPGPKLASSRILDEPTHTYTYPHVHALYM
mgnify:FL=1